MRSQPKRLDRVAVFVLLLALLSAVAASWLWSGRVRSAQEQERRDLNLFLEASSAGWSEVTDQFFEVPESAAQSVGALVGHMDSIEERVILLAETVRISPAVDSAFIGYPDGGFIFVARSDVESPGGFRTRQITTDGTERTVVLTWTDADRTELRREIDPDDSYDPRSRPWYIASDDSAQPSWTDPYIFSSSQQPGITYSTRVHDDQGNFAGVVGIDMRLSQLGGFLDQLAPGSNGDAMVLDANGKVIAASTMNSPPLSLAEVEGVLSEDAMQQLAISIDQVRQDEGSAARSRSADGLHTTVTRAVRGTEDWYLTVQAEDADFLGDFSNGKKKNLFGILAIGLATAIIVGSLGTWLRRYRDTLKAEAERDELTGLLSRRALRRLLDARLNDSQRPIAVAIIDLDGFKQVNDRNGHMVGDGVLAAMASRIDSFAATHKAVAGRLGGDEFAVIGGTDTDWSLLISQLSEPLHVESQEFLLGASIGVAHAEASSDTRAEDLLRDADRALFTVKRTGGGRTAMAGPSALV